VCGGVVRAGPAHPPGGRLRPSRGAAWNIGVRSDRGRLLAFCDADDGVRPGSIASMGAALSGADLVAGCSTSARWTGPESFPGPAPTRQLEFLPFGLSTNLAVPGEVSEAVHGFDEELSPEDVDPCWRLQLAGHRFGVATGPPLYVHHCAEGMRRDLRGAAKAWIW
jgi:hypothetical protein